MAKVVLITGGARGIGRAAAVLAANSGWDVAVGYRERADAAGEAVREIENCGRKAVAVRGEMAQESDVVAMYAAAERALGRIGAVVNSAGIAVQARVDSLSAPDVARMFAVNVIGLMVSCREAVRRMSTARGGKGGTIVNVSSMAATVGGRPRATAYAASKGAVDVFTTGLAKEVAAEGIRVNVVRPGVTDTEMLGALRTDPVRRQQVAASIPMQRFGTPEEVAAAIVWLISDQASFVTGAHVNVGGGGFLVSPATN